MNAEWPQCTGCGWGLSPPAPRNQPSSSALNDMTEQQKRMVAFDDWFAEAEKDLAWRMRWMHCEMRRDANHEPTWKRRRRS